MASVPRSIETPVESHEQCATATLRLLEAAHAAKVRRLVYAGSSSAYGDQPSSARRERDPLMPTSPYAAAKVAGEMYCKAYTASNGLETVCLRYFNVFGPRQDPHGDYAAVIPKFVTRMVEGLPPTIFGSGRQSRDFIYVDDVVRSNLLAADAKGMAGCCVNIASGRQCNLLELVETINRVLGTSIDPEFDEPRPGDIMESLADVGLASCLMGFSPEIDLEEGLKRSIEFYKNA